MNSKEILNRAAGLIEKKGLAFETAESKTGAVCTAAALVRAAYKGDTNTLKRTGLRTPGWQEKDYVNARNVFCGLLGINSSYESIVQWNDDFRTDKVGNKTYKRTKDEVVITLRKAAQMTEDPSKIVYTKPSK